MRMSSRSALMYDAMPAMSPPARYFGSMVYDVQRQVTVLYGGLSPTFFGANYLDDTLSVIDLRPDSPDYLYLLRTVK